jgi:hypothetical protein
MDISKIGDGKLQEAFDEALAEARVSVHDAWSKRNKDGFSTAKITITLTIDGLMDSDSEELDWAVKVACPPRVSPAAGEPVGDYQQSLPGMQL